MRLITKHSCPVAHQEVGDGPAHQASRLCCTSAGQAFACDGDDLIRIDLNDASIDAEGTALKPSRVLTARSRLQSVYAYKETVVAVDGLCRVSLSTDGGNSFQVRPRAIAPSRNQPEFGYCGLSFNNVDSSCGVSSMWGRETFILDSTVRFEHELPPTSISGSPSKPGVYIVTEWNDVTVWDTRAPRGGLVERLTGNQVGGGGNGPLWSCDSNGNYFAVGGEDRTVSLFDDRRLRIVETWKTPLKHDIIAVKLFDTRENLKQCVVGGLDHEAATWIPPLTVSKKRQKKDSSANDESSSTNPMSDGLGNTTTGTTQVPLQPDDEEERRVNFGRLHHNHRVFRSRSRWTGICYNEAPNEIIGRDTDGTVYRFAL